jgi:hypothetical protein
MKTAEKLHNHYDFDLVVSCFSPTESLFTGNYLKKKFGVRFCTYFADTLTDNLPKHHFFTKSFMDNMGYRCERKFFKGSDLILNLKCHEQNFLETKYDFWRHKMKIVDIPHLKNRIFETVSSPSTYKEINIVYTGNIRNNLIQPVLQMLKNVGKIKLHFYGANNIIVPDLDFIVKHGMVSRNEALAVQENANILLSMGNKDSSFIPSKIFEYISTGKKIVHFCFDEHDSAFPYYNKYKNCLFINVRLCKVIKY